MHTTVLLKLAEVCEESLLLLLLLCDLSSRLLEGFTRGSGPVVLGLGHSVSKIDVLGPALLGVGSSFEVEFGVILEDSGLGNILCVVGGLLLHLTLADGIVLLGGQTGRDIRLSCFNLSESQLSIGFKNWNETMLDYLSSAFSNTVHTLPSTKN